TLGNDCAKLSRSCSERNFFPMRGCILSVPPTQKSPAHEPSPDAPQLLSPPDPRIAFRSGSHTLYCEMLEKRGVISPRMPPSTLPQERSSGREATGGSRHLAGDLKEQGFIFTWHQSPGSEAWDCSKLFHDETVEICLNVEGVGSVLATGMRGDFGPSA